MAAIANILSGLLSKVKPEKKKKTRYKEPKLTRREKRERFRRRLESLTPEEQKYLKRKQFFETVWPIFRAVIVFGLCFIILYPLIFMISSAFRPRAEMNDPTIMWIPKTFTLSNIKDAARAMDFGNTLKNTLILNIGCSLVQVVTCALTGYGFARFKFKGRNILFFVVIMMILVPSQIILIPQYMFFRYFNPLGIYHMITGEYINLINTAVTMYFPAFTANGIRAGLFIYLFRQSFRGLPKELEDAAYLDGCSPFRTFVQVMIPNAGSTFLTVFLLSVVWYWNDYFVSTSFFTDNRTIALMLKNLDANLTRIIFDNGNIQVNVRELIVWMESGCLISITPMLIMYILLQKNFTEGIARSGLTGM
ncbi:MAG: carbohydrate ABC transporter permease [Oscillospiraceae bacterium]|nr:carbohydrate ABC transporter permease [Oscillospiraceae bacterium]